MIIRTVFILLSWSTLCLAVDSSWTTVNSVSDLEGAAAAIFEDIDPEASRDHYDDKWLQKDDWDLNRRPETKETYDWDGQKLDWNRQTADVSVMEQTPKKDKWKNVYHKAATGGRARYHKDGKEKKAGFDKTWDSSDDKVEDEEEEDEPSEAEENAGYKKSAHQPKNVRILRQHQTGFVDSDHDEDTNTPTTTMPSRGYGYPPRNARNQQPQPQHSHYRPPLAGPQSSSPPASGK
ncbi:hypothetical protein HDE_14530 [Halotydeus destructor]|nr:hypothetical protein HDE_14530 [Halotydeus destructor]